MRYRYHFLEVLRENLPIDENLLGAEIGCWVGGFSKELLSHFSCLSLYMVDCWEKGAGLNLTQKKKNRTKERLAQAYQEALSNTEFASDRRIVVKDFSDKASSLVPDNSLDFVFIDANHMYEEVKKDLVLWFPKVKQGGIFSGHDYDGQGDQQSGWGVKRAVDEFLSDTPYEITVSFPNVWWFVK